MVDPGHPPGGPTGPTGLTEAEATLAVARVVRQLLEARGARGDLALVRPTWMPAALVEGLFMMVPEQEAALRSDEGRRRYATAVVEGVAEFLAGLAGAPGGG